MVSQRTIGDHIVYLCDECGFGYSNLETAQECQDYCSTHNACSFEITQNAIYRPQNSRAV
ncbi:MAG: hypothetical protein M1503_00885 [Thaumarchaeota archaeon]|nr:hypothetical protein [Nitrososphaerota archaeon]MCL5316809.1 hypothetical protein [Nitrososphaerota archaeon]